MAFVWTTASQVQKITNPGLSAIVISRDLIFLILYFNQYKFIRLGLHFFKQLQKKNIFPKHNSTEYQQKYATQKIEHGAPRRNRTGTLSPERDFECSRSAL